MNATLLASQIVARIRASMQDSAINQEIMVAGMIREAMDAERFAMLRDIEIRARTQSAHPYGPTPHPQTVPDPTWPPRPGTFH